MEIVLASRNKKKVEELRKIMEAAIAAETDVSVNILTPDAFPECGDVEEDGDTFEANAVKKAVYISKITGSCWMRWRVFRKGKGPPVLFAVLHWRREMT
jgi:XTP/dITP diphosphohydrolase